MRQGLEKQGKPVTYGMKIRGSGIRAVGGGVVGSILLGIASAIQGDAGIGVLIGAIFGFAIGVVVALIVFITRISSKILYFVIGALVAVLFLILVSNSGSIQFGDLIETDNNIIPVTLTAVLGGIIAVVISRYIARD